MAKFDKLDDNGFVKDVHITDKDIIIGRREKIKRSGSLITKASENINFGTSETVDKVSVLKNKEGLRSCKELEKLNHQIQVMGLVSRFGQKDVEHI